MKRTLLAPALVSLLFVLQACDDVGKCTDPLEGREPVVDGQGRVLYAGQAIALTSCANGCHSSKADGALRVGAPKGLDFDVTPVTASAVEARTDATGKTVYVAKTDDAAGLAGLRQRQRKVFDLRDMLYDQVKEGLMPPPEVGAAFRSLSNLATFTKESDDSCTRGTPFDAVNKGDGREKFRNWLACGAPVVEISAPNCAGPAPVGNEVCLPVPAPGTVGDQFPECPIVGEANFDTVYSQVFMAGTCTLAGCHGANPQAGLDLSTPEIAYMDLLGGGDGEPVTTACPSGQTVRVSPGNPDESSLVAKLENTCGPIMPPSGMLSPGQLKLVRDWIAAGAPGPGEGGGDTDAGM